MKKVVFRVVGVAASILAAVSLEAGAQEGNGPLFDQGRAIYEENCAACHQETGKGVPPNFPALNGNGRLADHAFIVRQVRAGKEAMPAFTDLGAEEIAAVASYIRNAWSNDFGPVTATEAAQILTTVKVTEASRSILDGVYTESQAKSARLIYLGACAACHGSRLNGAPDEADMSPGPPLAGVAFLREWDGRTLAALFEYARTTMPIRNPGQLSDKQYIDVIAYMLSYGKFPAGDEKLVPDMSVLADILIEKNPAAE
uniref:cytochrome c n=1 Tax=Pararhizobium sp. IMCC3301 TaxID=3067904 RepID=UPI00274105AB|nr:cytochrome c [Pararhizobium sp. IMCC3301]